MFICICVRSSKFPTYCPNFQSWIYVLIPLLVLPQYWWWIIYLKSNWKDTYKNRNLSFRYLIHNYNQSPLLPFHHNVCKRIIEENKKRQIWFLQKDMCLFSVCVLHNIIISSIMLDNCIRAFGFYLSYKEWMLTNSERKRQDFSNFLCSMSKKMVNGLNIPWDVQAIYLLKFENSSNNLKICYYL